MHTVTRMEFFRALARGGVLGLVSLVVWMLARQGKIAACPGMLCAACPQSADCRSKQP